MNIFPISFILIGIFSSIVKTQWVLVGRIDPSVYANLTLRQEHKLMLQKLASRDDQFLATSFQLEMLARSIGNYFFPFPIDKNLAKENKAIIKATLECLKRLLIQDKIERILKTVYENSARYVHTFGSYSLAFSLMCSDLDFFLRNETFYVEHRDEYKRQCHLAPKKVYHYGFSRSQEAEFKAIEKLLNEPALKALMAHMSWIWMTDSFNATLKDMKNSIVKLAKIPEIFEKVQKNYEKSINEIIPRMKRIDAFFLRYETRENYFNYIQSNFTEKLWSRIIHDIPDWKDYLECDPGSDTKAPDSSVTNAGRCGRTKVTPASIFKDAWPVTSDFDSSELVNLTSKQEHELFLKALPRNKNSAMLQNIFILELLAKTIGNDFFSFVTDEKSNIRNNAVIKAAFDCISNLMIQFQARNLIDVIVIYATQYVMKTGDITDGLNQLCLTIDKSFENVTVYTTNRDEYMKQNLSIPKKVYQYSIGNPTEDQRKIAAKLVNHPNVKKIWLHFLWMRVNGTANPINELQRTKYTILELAKVPSKSETVQRLYEQSVEETIQFFKDFTYDSIFHADSFLVRLEVTHIFSYVTLLMKQVVINIKKSPDDLVTVYDAIVEQSRPKPQPLR